MRKKSWMKIGRSMAAFALAAVMLGSAPNVSDVSKVSGQISVSAASKFTFDGNNVSKYKGSKTFVISKNVSSKSLGAIKKAYKKNESLFLKVQRLEFGNDVTKVSADLLTYFPNTQTLVMGKKVVDIPESEGFTQKGTEILPKLSNIEVNAKNEEYSSENGVLYNKKKTAIVKVPAAYSKASYSMPDTVKKLASDYAMVNCSKMTTLSISKSFEGKLRKLNLLTSLNKINVAAGNTDFKSIDGVLYSADETKLICWPAADKTKNVVLPSTLKELNVDALPKTVTALTLPKGLTSLYSDSKESYYYPKNYPLNALPELSQIAVEQGSETFVVEGGGLYNAKKTVCYGIPLKTAVVDIVIPEGIEGVNYSLFYEHKTIQTISIPATLKTIDPAVTLSGNDTMTGLTAFSVAKENTCVKAVDGVLYSADDKELCVYPIAKPGNEYAIPDTVIKVHANALSPKCKNIVKLTIGKSVNDIVQGIDLPNLTEYVVSDENASFCARDGVLYLKDLTAICGYPRKKKDKTFEIASTVRNIEYYNDFKNDYLKELDIQGDISYFPNNFNENVPGIESFSAGSESDYKAKNGVLYSSDMKEIICYPCSKDNTNFIVPETVTYICTGAMQNNKYLKKVTLSKKFTRICDSLFLGCKKLTAIEVDKGNKKFASQDGVLYNKSKTDLLLYPNGKKGNTLTLLKSVKKVSCPTKYMLENSNLKKVKVAKDNKTLVSDGKTVTNAKTKTVVFTLLLEE